MVTGCKLGMDVRLCAPKALWPEEDLVASAAALPQRPGPAMTITRTRPLREAGQAASDFLHTDVWVSMGEAEEVWDSNKIQQLKPYQVNGES